MGPEIKLDNTYSDEEGILTSTDDKAEKKQKAWGIIQEYIPSVVDFAQDVFNIATGSSQSTDSTQTTPVTTEESNKNRTWLWVGIAAAAAIIITVVLILVFRKK